MAEGDTKKLRAENARLMAEMASMKKKMMLAMKKQGAEMKVSQQRAEAAEAALAATSLGSPRTVDSHSGIMSNYVASGQASALDLSIGHVSSEGNNVKDEGGGDPGTDETEDSVKDHERQRAEKELLELRETLAAEARRAAEERHKLEVEMTNLKSTSEQAIEQLMEKNRLLAYQLEDMSRQRVELTHTISSLTSSSQQEDSTQTETLHGDLVRVYDNGDALPTSDLQQQLQATKSKVQSLEVELRERLESQQAAETATLEAKMSCTVAEERAADLLGKLEQATTQQGEETNGGDVKYRELDAKFGRLLKRSKQRIQEVQKEKDDLEEQFKSVEEKATQALARQAALQADLDLTRNQAGGAIRNLDTERQQITTALRRTKQDIEELRLALEAKEHELTEYQSLVSEKDQKILEMTSELKEAEYVHENAITGLKETHQKVLEDHEMQLMDAVKDCSRLDESLSSLQVQLADKEFRLAEVEAAGTGELVRLGALLEAARGDNQRLQAEQEAEREEHMSTVSMLMSKLEESEVFLHDVEMAAASTRSQLESELEGLRQAFSASQAELDTARNETKFQIQELAAYKVRAHALVQKKEAALLAAQDSVSLATLELSLQEAKVEAAAASAARDQSVKMLEAAVAEYQSKLQAQADAIEDAENHMKELATQLELSKSLLLSQQGRYEKRLAEAEESRNLRSEAPVAESRAEQVDLAGELGAIRLSEQQLKAEFESYKEMTNSMMASKEEELMRLLDEKAALQKLVSFEKTVDVNVVDTPVTNSHPPLAEQQILVLARLQAQREEQVTLCHRHIEALQEEIKELEQENRVRCHQITMLKEEIQNSERSQKRSTVDMTYVKNVIVKLLETGEVEALLPVIAMLLQFSPEESRRCQEAYRMQGAGEVPLSGAAAVVDAASAAPRSLISRFSLS